MRVEFIRPGLAEIVTEVGDEVALVDVGTRERVTDPVRIREVPCRVEWNVERRTRAGWGLYDEAGRLVWIGDVHWVHPGDIYTLDVPPEWSRS